jgi:hypothetical protein
MLRRYLRTVQRARSRHVQSYAGGVIFFTDGGLWAWGYGEMGITPSPQVGGTTDTQVGIWGSPHNPKWGDAQLGIPTGPQVANGKGRKGGGKRWWETPHAHRWGYGDMGRSTDTQVGRPTDGEAHRPTHGDMGKPTAPQAHRWGSTQAHMCIPTCGGPHLGRWGHGDMGVMPKAGASIR